MKIGNGNVKDIKRGSTDINYVYRGENLVWERVLEEEFVLTIGENSTIRKWDLDGNEDTSGNWPITIGSPAVRISSLDYSYDHQFFMICGHRGAGAGVLGYEKFDLDGNSIFSTGSVSNNDSRAISIVNSTGDFFPEKSGVLIKFDKDNNQIYEESSSWGGRLFASYTNGNYVARVGAVNNSLSIDLWNINGTHIFSKNVSGDTAGVYVDVSGNLYTNSNVGNSLTTRKYNVSGDLLWSYNHGTSALGILVDSDGNVYIGGVRISNVTHRKLGSDGSLIWSRDHGSNTAIRADKAIDIDSDGNIWFAFTRNSNITHRKYSPAGDLLVSIDHGVNGNGVRVIRKKL